MGIYQQIQKNKRNTLLLFGGFTFLIVAVVYAVALIIDPGFAYVFVAMAFLVTLVGSFLSYFHSDKLLLKMADARPVSKEMEPHLYHTIEGVAVAAGIPTPKAYIIETDVPNAFATGRNPDNSAVAVTRGLMKTLNREEMEGVVAHEMAHIKNYDILFTTLAIVLTGTLVYLARILSRVFLTGGRMRSGGGRGGAAQIVILLAVGIITAIIAPLAAKTAQMAISRNREYLADATAANMLGYPLGLASALEKLDRHNNPAKALQDGFANEANAGLFIVNPLKMASADSLFSTHPPIKKRVERLRKM